jgi:hypothetical protein
VSSTAGLKDADQVTPSAISTRNLIEPIFMKTFYIGVIAPLAFAYLGSSNVLAPFYGQSQWLVSVLARIWPVLPAQYELVWEVRGPGHAASYGFMCAALWAWPVFCAVVYLWEHAKRRKEILPISPKEIGQFMVAFPFAVLVLVFDSTGIASPVFGFHADKPVLFYLRQWFLFALVALVLGILLYALGRTILDRIWRQTG